MLQSLLQLIRPLGRPARGLRRWLMGGTPPIRRAARECRIVFVNGDPARAAAECRELLRQPERPEVALAGGEHELARVPSFAEVHRLVLQPSPSGPPVLRPQRPAMPRHVVLQADDFTEGGMEQVVIDLAQALQADGFTASLLILGREGTAAQRARERGLSVDCVPRDEAAYTAHLQRRGPALVNAHYSTFGAALCAARGIPFVHTLHNMYMWFGPAQVAAYRAADPHTHAYICVSNGVARFAERNIGLSPAGMVVVPNGCDRSYLCTPAHLEAAAALRAGFGIAARATVFLNVASVQPSKGQHLLLAAFAQLASELSDAHLIVLGGAGDADYLRAQQQETARLGLQERVHWVGRRDDVHGFHQLATALVQPSFFEGWSLAITEAVLAGLPVIATDVGGALEQLRGTDGILVPPAAADPCAIDAATLLPLLRGAHPELVARLAAAMRAVAARGGVRSRLPVDWELLLRDVAYRRCADLFHWFAGGGSPTGARRWSDPGVLAGASA